MGTHTWAAGQRFRLKSLRVRIILFAALVCLVLFVLIAVAIGVLRNSQSANLNKAERHLHTVALSLGRTFQANPSYASSLAQLDEPKPHPLQEFKPGEGQSPSPGSPPPPPPPPPSLNKESLQLRQLMSNTLTPEDGVEGGYYLLRNGALGGYSFPTHEAPGPPKEMPVRERPTIEELAHSAATTGVEQKLRFQGQHDAVLFESIPLRASSAAGSPVVGAAWFMERLPGAEGEQHRQLLWGALGFALMALLICAAAFVILSEVRGGLHSVSTRLTAIVSGAEAAHEENTTLEEFAEVLTGIDRMARDLQMKVQRERSLEAQVAHQERLAAVGQFAAGIAHELRNPLATIRLRTQMSQQAGGDAMTATNARVVLAEIDRLNAMIGKLLHFARPIHMHATLLDLATVARVCAQRWNEECGAGSVEIRQPALSLIVSGDGEEFRQVFDNLLENAFQASGQKNERPFAEIEIAVSSEYVTVHVFDHGPGFDEESLHKALQPFYTTKERGTGLGLAIASEIVRAHDGTLSVGNRKGGGGSVQFQVPAHPSNAAVEDGQNG